MTGIVDATSHALANESDENGRRFGLAGQRNRIVEVIEGHGHWGTGPWASSDKTAAMA